MVVLVGTIISSAIINNETKRNTKPYKENILLFGNFSDHSSYITQPFPARKYVESKKKRR